MADVYLDTETTGFISDDPGVWEIAICHVENFEIVKKYVRQFNPQRPFSEGAKAVSGIDPKTLENKPLFSDHIVEIYKALNGNRVYGWNVEKFDNPVLKLEFDRAGFPFPKYETIDLLALARGNLSRQEVENACGNKIFSLQNVAKFFGVNQTEGNHRAFQDVETTVLVARELYRYIEETKTELAQKTEFSQKTELAQKPGSANTDLLVKTIKDSLELLKTLSAEATKTLNNTIKIVSSTEESKKAGEKILGIRSMIRKMSTGRTTSLAPAKNVIKAVEKLYADEIAFLTKEASRIESERSRFLIERSRKSEEIGNAVFESMKDKNLTTALASAENAAELAKVQKSEFSDEKKIVNKAVFTAEIVNAERIPEEFWTPDIKKIERHATDLFDAFGVEPTIPGVVLTCRIEAKSR